MTKKILVVDDESSIRDALSKVLHAEDYEVVSAENGQEAIEKLAEKIDLLLLTRPAGERRLGYLKWLAESIHSCPSLLSRVAATTRTGGEGGRGCLNG